MKKPLIVQKFGGTSVGSIERIHAVAKHIIKAKNDGNQVVVVVSAMSGETNRLMGLAKQIDAVPTARELDVLLSAGEQVSMALLAMTLNKLGHAACSLTGAQASIVTNEQHNDATITHIDTATINRLLAQEQIVIVAGFQGINEHGDITTLGRGGSDTSAVTLAGVLSADECQIFTDVDGIYTSDPRLVKHTQKMNVISFQDMHHMAKKGAKVLQLQSVDYAWQHNVPLRVLSSFSGEEGTLVTERPNNPTHSRGLAIQQNQSLLQLSVSDAEVLRTQCQLLGISYWNVITHADSEYCVVANDCLPHLNLVFADKIRDIEAVCTLTLVGHEVEGIAEKACDQLSTKGITVRQSQQSERYISILINAADLIEAANYLHETFVVSVKSLDNAELIAVS
ncbi:aspartate kinase [Vibrio sp. Of7-15]|uniref:aspartate kinase n=1 Tax=Vibrio sp. Of7-15 TaxID=2724879 RepID=UPI001EF25D44|nr:aspartate kinase [Vibrio sp. Of7-15]